VNDAITRLSDGVIRETTHGGRDDGAVVRENFLPLPVDRTVELRIEIGESFDGEIGGFPDLAGARVKPVVFVPEERAELFDRDALREKLEEAGAIYVKAPTVHTIRRVVRRDARHDVDVPLEESLRIFAEETKPRDADAKVEFAAALAREADAGEGSG
jgi:hypothetical protein